MTKLAPEWVRTSDPVIRSPARYRWTTAPPTKCRVHWMFYDHFSARSLLAKLGRYKMQGNILLTSLHWHFLGCPPHRERSGNVHILYCQNLFFQIAMETLFSHYFNVEIFSYSHSISACYMKASLFLYKYWSYFTACKKKKLINHICPVCNDSNSDYNCYMDAVIVHGNITETYRLFWTDIRKITDLAIDDLSTSTFIMTEMCEKLPLFGLGIFVDQKLAVSPASRNLNA